jgi:hypothetical protein
MYESLREISQQLLLAGLQDVPRNALYVMESDGRFLEAFMVGLNHEMGRLLEWREFPYPRRATFFRSFWAGTGDRGDIPEIAAWDPAKPLGGNSTGWSPKPLILLVRSDLLRRYPDTGIYARQAVVVGGRRQPTGSRLDPIFRGDLDPDLTFLGFDLTLSDAVGGQASPGWFFVLEQHPHQPRFGLRQPDGIHADPPAWEQLSWSDLAADDQKLAAMKYAPATWPRGSGSLTLPLQQATGSPTFTWGSAGDAAQLAAIAMRAPVRVTIHASALLGSS